MASVIEEGDCPKCHSKDSLIMEFNTSYGAEWAHCQLCGYFRDIMTLKDRKKTEEVKRKVRDLLDKGDILGAIHECDYDNYLKTHQGKEFALNQVKSFLESKESPLDYIKLNKEGQCVLRRIERGGFGSYHIISEGIGRIGSLHSNPEKREKQIQRLQRLRRGKVKVEIIEFVNKEFRRW